jgi:hypothetical protein
MSPRALRRLFAAYAFAVSALFVLVRSYFALRPLERVVTVESWWEKGQRVGRLVHDRERLDYKPPITAFSVDERAIAEAPLPRALFTLGLVPGRDGVRAELNGKVAYATVDDLLSGGAYDRAHLHAEASFGWGTRRDVVFGVLARELGSTPREVEARATLRRVRFERAAARPPIVGIDLPAMPRPEHLTEANLTREIVTDALAEAATHLARNVGLDGRFRYSIDAATNATLEGYNWPRHAGATFFLAQAAVRLDNAFVRASALRAATHLRDYVLRACGVERCIAPEDSYAEIGSSALALIAFTEIVRNHLDHSFMDAIRALASFLRSQQRPDGEMQHLFDREKGVPIDVQYLYFTGEAALALARAHRITDDPRDLDASRRALARLSGGGWSFFGSRYYFSEEHWTCQAVAELWDRAPDSKALEFCARWHEVQRRLQQGASDSPFDGAGAFNFGPLATPRTTPASSRGAAAGALASGMQRTKDPRLSIVDHELGRALAFVLRQQFHPGPTHLFADPVAVRGALPGSPVDWQLRIDYTQHAGSMMDRWLELHPR